jgi:hypothetical protein
MDAFDPDYCEGVIESNLNFDPVAARCMLDIKDRSDNDLTNISASHYDASRWLFASHQMYVAFHC